MQYLQHPELYLLLAQAIRIETSRIFDLSISPSASPTTNSSHFYAPLIPPACSAPSVTSLVQVFIAITWITVTTPESLPFTISKLSDLYYGVTLIFKLYSNDHITPLLNDLQRHAFHFPNKSTSNFSLWHTRLPNTQLQFVFLALSSTIPTQII